MKFFHEFWFIYCQMFKHIGMRKHKVFTCLPILEKAKVENPCGKKNVAEIVSNHLLEWQRYFQPFVLNFQMMSTFTEHI